VKIGGKYRDKIHVTITGQAGDPPSCRIDLQAETVLTYRTFKAKPAAAQCPHCRRHAKIQIALGNWSS